MTPLEIARMGGRARAEKYQRIAREVTAEARRYGPHFRSAAQLCMFLIANRWREDWPPFWPADTEFDKATGRPDVNARQRRTIVDRFYRAFRAAGTSARNVTNSPR